MRHLLTYGFININYYVMINKKGGKHGLWKIYDWKYVYTIRIILYCYDFNIVYMRVLNVACVKSPRENLQQ